MTLNMFGLRFWSYLLSFRLNQYEMTLRWPWTYLALNCDHMYLVWGQSNNKCPDDPEMTLTLFSTPLWSHVPSLRPIHQEIPWWPWGDLELVWHSILITHSKFEVNPVSNTPMPLKQPFIAYNTLPLYKIFNFIHHIISMIWQHTGPILYNTYQHNIITIYQTRHSNNKDWSVSHISM